MSFYSFLRPRALGPFRAATGSAAFVLLLGPPVGADETRLARTDMTSCRPSVGVGFCPWLQDQLPA